MNITMLIAYLIIQLIVQFVFYSMVRNIILKAVIYSHHTFNLSADFSGKLLSFIVIFTNIIISLFVKVFTSAGAMTGMTNLGASVILGLIMSYDVWKVKRMLEE